MDKVVVRLIIDDPDQNLPVDNFTSSAKNLQILSILFIVCPGIVKDSWAHQGINHGNKKDSQLSSLGWTRS